MKICKVVLVFSLLLLLGVGSASAQFVPTGISPSLSVAQMGMGGLSTVVASNAHTLFYNPGMLTRQGFVFEVTVPAGLDGDILPMFNFIQDHSDDFANFESLSPSAQEQFLQDSQEFDNKWFGMSASPFIGLGWKNFGVGATANLNPAIKLDQGVLVPAIGMRGFLDVTMGAGVGRELEIGRKNFGIGATFRYMERYVVETQRVSATDAGSASDLFGTMLDEAAEPLTGFGLDVGAVHTLDLGDAGTGSSMDVAAVIKDLYGKIGDDGLQPNMQAGVMYHGTSGGFLLRRFDVGLEFTDLFNRQGVSFWQKINAGTEMSILGGLLTARGGIHQGYPTYGLGFRFLVIKVDAAYFTREMGSNPGQDPSDQYMVQASFGW